VPISELVFGALTQNRSSLEPSLARHAALWIMHDTYKPLKSRRGTPKGCGASGRTSMLCRSRLLPARKALPFSMRGVPAAANPRKDPRLLRFWVKAPNTNSEIGTTRLARACARNRAGPAQHHWEREGRPGIIAPRIGLTQNADGCEVHASGKPGTGNTDTRACGEFDGTRTCLQRN
jgi:hypothetical protein